MAHWVCRYGAQSEEWLQSFTAGRLFSLSFSHPCYLVMCPLLFHNSSSPGKWPKHLSCLLLTRTLNLLSSSLTQPLVVTLVLACECSTTSERCCTCACVLWVSRRLPGWLTGCVCEVRDDVGLETAEKLRDRWPVWQSDFRGSTVVGWGLALKQGLGLLLVSPSISV